MQEKAKNTIPNQKIYDDIIAFRGTQKYRDSESKLLLNKYAFLMDHVFYRKRSHFMDGSKAVVPEMEAAIVRNLLYKAITPSDNNLIMDWFNNTDFSDPYKTVELFEQIIKEVEKAVHTGETDPVTADECLHAISASLNYGGALYIIYLNREMNKFRIDSLAMNSTVIFGDVVITHEDGAREYLKKGNAANVNLDEKSLEQAIQSAENQDDYLNIIAQVIKKCSADAEEKTKERLIDFLSLAKAFDATSATDAISDEQISSEYIIWYQRIHDYLVNHQDVLEYVEKNTGVTDVASFFHMSPAIDIFCKNCGKNLKATYRLTGDFESIVWPDKEIKCAQCKRVMRMKKYTEKLVSQNAVNGKLYL